MKAKAIERISISREEFYQIENQIRLQEHLRRYASVRRFVYGRTVDFACGCGYGTFLLSNNPEITEVLGVDKDAESIEWAKKEYGTDKCKFVCDDVRNLSGKVDTLVSLETIEHFESDELYIEIIEKLSVDQLIISYPNKKSTHFNPFHKRDLNKQQVCEMFKAFVLYHTYSMGDVDFLLFLRKPERLPSHVVHNLIDFR